MDELIAENLARVRERTAAACKRAGRSTSEIMLVAVTKTVTADRIRAAYELGLADFGENRVQEAREKAPLLRDLPMSWHMIGHVQSNKASPVVDLFRWVHSVDSLEIAGHLSRRAAARGRRLAVLLEVNVGAEDAKSGFRLASAHDDAFFAAVQSILALPALEVQGLMTVAPLLPDADAVRPFFQRLRLLRDDLRVRWPGQAWPHLSMGMTDDFEAAIEEGATMIRLGRAIFGPRPG